MERKNTSNGFFKRVIRRLSKEGRGQVMAIFALALPVLIGSGALAVDVGYMMVARNLLQNAADAGARAGTVVLANGGTQAAATAAATNIANQNTAAAGTLAGAVPVVTFPAANSVRVVFNHNVPLYIAPIIGINTAAVGAIAVAQTVAVSSAPPLTMAPLAIACNNGAGCTGSLALNQTLTNARRYCGNFYANGPSGGSCGNTIGNGEIFLVGITFDNNNGTNAFRTAVRDGYDQEVLIDQQAQALPGNRNGWRDGMEDRLAAGGGEAELILPIIREATNPNGNFNIEVVDFVKVKITSFTRTGNTDQTTFTIIQSSVPSTSFATPGQGLGINSITAVRLIQ